MKLAKPKNVDEYIAQAPSSVRGKLKEFRRVIKEAAPEAEEKISYGMPYYGYRGRLAYFANFKNHVSLFVPPPIIAEHPKELKSYKTTKSSVHFPIDESLPGMLVKKLVIARMRYNEAKSNK